MTNIIKIKRGSGAPSTGVLNDYELGWDFTNKRLYMGVDSSDPIKIVDSFEDHITIDSGTGKLTATQDFQVDGFSTFNQTVTVAGNLIVQGTTTTVNSDIVTIKDPIFTLGETLLVDDAKDRGIEFNHGDIGSPFVGFFGFDDSTGRFTFIPDATNTTEVFSGNAGDFEVGEIYQPQTDGAYDVAGSVVNASANWNAAAKAMAGASSGTQYDILLADVNGVFQSTKLIPSAAGIFIDCGTY